jgi:hypothetical protein
MLKPVSERPVSPVSPKMTSRERLKVFLKDIETRPNGIDYVGILEFSDKAGRPLRIASAKRAGVSLTEAEVSRLIDDEYARYLSGGRLTQTEWALHTRNGKCLIPIANHGTAGHEIQELVLFYSTGSFDDWQGAFEF